NSWWYVSDYGVPTGLWVTIAGWVLALACFVAAIVRLVRVWRWRYAAVDPDTADGPLAGAEAPGREVGHGRSVREKAGKRARRRLAALPSFAPLPLAA